MTEQQINPHILVVEDDPIQAMKLEALLQSVGCAVRVATNGREALAMMAEARPDIVVSDILMPEMDGYEMCKQIRNSQELKQVAVILLTCLSEPQDVIRGLEAGADNFLAKPYESSGLVRMVKEMHEGRTAHGKDSTRVRFHGESYVVNSTRGQILNFFLTLYEDTLLKNEDLARAQKELQYVNENLARLVHERTADLSQEVESRKKAEEESRERAQLLDKAHDAILVVDLDGVIRYCNRSAKNLYGWSEPEMIGRQVSVLLHDDKRPFPVEAMTAVQEKGEWLEELRQVTMGGQEVTVMSSWTLVRDERQRPRAILCINTNLTDKKRLEAQFLRSQRLESIGTLAGGISHDLNNLIAPILLAARLLRKGIQDPDLLRIIGLLESGATRATGIVTQLLSFARGSGEDRLLMQVQHVMKETQQIVRESLSLAIDVQVDFTRDLMPVMGDPTQIQQVLMNLCINARDAMPQGGLITLSAKNVMIDETFASMHREAKAGPYVLLSVKDSGTGMPHEIQEKIFEPFFTTKEVGKGTGLGLSTVQAIVRGHGGFICLTSEPGAGSEFSIYLPAVPDGCEVDALKQENSACYGDGETILLVDDEQIVREMTTLTLEGFGYQVVAASDGTEALAEYAKDMDRFAAVVTDLAMPHLDGLSTIKALRKLNPGVCIVAISGHDDAILKAKAKLDPSIPVLRKPFTADRLLVCLHERLAEPAKA